MTGRRRERELMVELQLAGRGVGDARVLAAMATVERERFVPVDHADDAYADLDLPIGYGQVLHRPETLARALELLELTGGERLLVVGAGSGYPAAVAALLAREVVATERVPQLAARAARNLAGSARVLAVDGTQGVAVGAAVRRRRWCSRRAPARRRGWRTSWRRAGGSCTSRRTAIGGARDRRSRPSSRVDCAPGCALRALDRTAPRDASCSTPPRRRPASPASRRASATRTTGCS